MKRCINWFQCHLSKKDHDEKFKIVQPSNTIDLKKNVDSSKLKKQFDALVEENNSLEVKVAEMDRTIQGLCEANSLLKKELNDNIARNKANGSKEEYYKLVEKSRSIEQAYVNILDRFEKLEYKHRDLQLLVTSSREQLAIKKREYQELEQMYEDFQAEHSLTKLECGKLMLERSNLDRRLEEQTAQTCEWKDKYGKYAPRLERVEKELIVKTLEIVNLRNELNHRK